MIYYTRETVYLIGLLIHGLGTSWSSLRGCHLVFFCVFKHSVVIRNLFKVCDFVALAVEIIVAFCVFVIVIAVVTVRGNEIIIVIIIVL